MLENDDTTHFEFSTVSPNDTGVSIDAAAAADRSLNLIACHLAVIGQ